MCRSLLFTLSVVLACCLNSISAAEPHFSDASVRAIQFVDAQEGWAVGDEGVIWHSIDGGETWERQPSGVRASLRAIHFLTPYTGWVVGRQELADGRSVGVILKTTDGGLKWSPTGIHAVPGLNSVQFFNERTGIAAGDGSDSFPSGVFLSNDGGNTWKALPGNRTASWKSADFSSEKSGILAGASSQLATVREGIFGSADVESLADRTIHQLKLRKNFAVAVGQGGLVLISPDSAGTRWGFPDLPLTRQLRACCDFHSVAIAGNHLWVVGRPGSFVLHSPDLGRTWEMQRTGQPLPLHSVHFLNEKQGWAVGEFGTILTTTDGGTRWIVRKQGGQRAAAMVISADSSKIPLDVLAILGLEEGYLTTVLRVTCADPANLRSSSPSERLVSLSRELRQNRKITDPELLATAIAEESNRQKRAAAHAREVTDPERLLWATRLSGGASAESLWQFPLPKFLSATEARDILTKWDRLHGTQASGELLRQLVLALRIWQPEIILTGNPGSPAETLIAEAVKEAARRAADPESFPEQLDVLKLGLWSPKKIFQADDKASPTSIRYDVSQFQPRLAETPKNFVFPQARLLDENAENPEARFFTPLASLTTEIDLFAGIPLAPGGASRRTLANLTKAELDTAKNLELRVQDRRNLELLVNPVKNPLANPEAALAHIGKTIQEMPQEMGATTIWTVADHYVRIGRWDLAREAFLLMVDRYPAHPQSLEAYRWLVRWHSSAEVQRRQELRQFIYESTIEPKVLPSEVVNGITGVVKPNEGTSKRPIARNTPVAPKKPLPTVSQTGFEENRIVENYRDPAMTKNWLETALSLETKIAAYGPMFASDPGIQLCLQSAKRQLGDQDSPRKWFAKYLNDTAAPSREESGGDIWRECIMAEAWLTQVKEYRTPPKNIAYARSTAKRPVLDGKLDDACWQEAKVLPIGSVGEVPEGYTTKARICWDSEYLYLAVECTHPEGKGLPAVEKRQRDADLRNTDRVSIMLDLDRDYQTYYQFQIDQRGCLADDCWGDRSWNPKWFVAFVNDATSWTAEIAIPMTEIVTSPPSIGQTWACNVVRVLPGRGVQAFSTPADASPKPEGMGLLQFMAGSR